VSINRILDVVRDNYSTYRDEQSLTPERHYFRLISQSIVALVIATFVKELSDDNISVLVTALSILIGFAFAAMFPIALESVAGLPRPLYAEDRDDIKVIRQLAVYFRFNVAYFIPLTLFCVATLLVQMLSFSIPRISPPLNNILSIKWTGKEQFSSVMCLLVPRMMLGISVLLLQESCYTFYRMCFNALALLRIKEEYIANRPD
jgi:hypothetical protein